MTLFEYITVPISIVLSFAVVRVLDGRIVEDEPQIPIIPDPPVTSDDELLERHNGNDEEE